VVVVSSVISAGRDRRFYTRSETRNRRRNGGAA
jgi:hypothetical protein